MWSSSGESVCCICGGWLEANVPREAKHLEAINGAMKEGTRMELTEEVDKWKIVACGITG